MVSSTCAGRCVLQIFGILTLMVKSLHWSQIFGEMWPWGRRVNTVNILLGTRSSLWLFGEAWHAHTTQWFFKYNENSPFLTKNIFYRSFKSQNEKKNWLEYFNFAISHFKTHIVRSKQLWESQVSRIQYFSFLICFCGPQGDGGGTTCQNIQSRIILQGF